MKYILKLIVFVFVSNAAFAQQIPLTSQYMFNDYLLNPAVAGSTEYMPISLSGRAQWTGLDGAPKTQFLSLHSKLGEKMGVGGYVYRDETGPIREQGVQLSYAYHLTVSDNSKLSFSLAGILFFHDINQAAFKPEDNDDDALNNLKVNAMSPDINFGIMYYSDKFKFGISSPQLLQNKMYGDISSQNLNKLVRHYYFFGEYKFAINDDIAIVPSTLVKYVQGAPFQFDFNARGVYKEKYWLGASFRYNNAIAAIAGLTYKNFSFGYAYDYTLTDINNYSNGGHEIFLQLKIFKKAPQASKKFD